MVELQPLEHKDCKKLVAWNADKDENYLYQWAGHKVYTFPLTVEQISTRFGQENLLFFKLLDNSEMIGCVELAKIDKAAGYAQICRFILRDDRCGNGLGQIALRQLVAFAFEDLKLLRLELNVYTFNLRAIQCYLNVGFVIDEQNDHPDNPHWNVFSMSITKGKDDL